MLGDSTYVHCALAMYKMSSTWVWWPNIESIQFCTLDRHYSNGPRAIKMLIYDDPSYIKFFLKGLTSFLEYNNANNDSPEIQAQHEFQSPLVKRKRPKRISAKVENDTLCDFVCNFFVHFSSCDTWHSRTLYGVWVLHFLIFCSMPKAIG
jgi:hypothetical protein